MSDPSEPEILFEQRGAVGLITLNRPKALNSLTTGMCEALHARLMAWAEDSAIQAVVVLGAGEKAFCAGGDVVQVVKSAQSGGTTHHAFFRSEYRMNVAIDEFPKPYIALVDGITMGGGVGVSMPGDYWIATEKTLFSMPETALGLFPDVGGGWFLPRLPGSLGMYLALTGARLQAGDLYHSGIASHVVQSADIPHLIESLSAGFVDQEALENLLSRYHSAPDAGPVSAQRARLDDLFGVSSVDGILANLNAGDSQAQEMAADLLTKSPTSLKLTFEQLMRGGAAKTFREVMQMEFRLVSRCVFGHDFPEGVRALLIDKDRNTKWSPATLDAVSDADIAAYFDPLDEELTF